MTVTAIEKPSLFAEFPAIWGTHLRLTHHRDNLFNATFPYLYPTGYGNNKTPFEMWEPGLSTGVVEFAMGDNGTIVGLALFGTAGIPTSRELSGGLVEERADAWWYRG